MYFMVDSRLKIAYTKSNEVLDALTYTDNNMISTQKIIDIVEKKLNCEIITSSCSFSEVSEDIQDYGAMMCTTVSRSGKREAIIVLNSDNDSEFQRFSLVHELGHLMTSQENLFNTNESYVVSTHINYRISSISQEEYQSDDFLLKEQLANIFALRVLMPSKLFFKTLESIDSLSKIAKNFGLTNEAVVSRIMLVE